MTTQSTDHATYTHIHILYLYILYGIYHIRRLFILLTIFRYIGTCIIIGLFNLFLFFFLYEACDLFVILVFLFYRSKSRSVDHGLAAPFDLDSLRSKVEGRFESVDRLTSEYWNLNINLFVFYEGILNK